MEAANLNFYGVNSYLDVALSSGFLVVSNHNYEITEKGKMVLEKYLELTNNLNEVKRSLEKIKEEKKALENVVDSKINKKMNEEEISIEKKDKPPIIKISFERINPQEFYGELTTLGFSKVAAMEIISWIDLIYKKDKFLLMGKTASVIKACLACNGAVILGASNVTRYTVRLFFKVDYHSIQSSYKAFRQLVLEEKPELTK